MSLLLCHIPITVNKKYKEQMFVNIRIRNEKNESLSCGCCYEEIKILPSANEVAGR